MVPFDTFQPLSTPILNTWYLSRFIFPGGIFVMHGGLGNAVCKSPKPCRP